MSDRATRREILAAIALTDELPMPHMVSFADGRFTLYLDTVAELRRWLPYFGMAEEQVSTQPYTHKDGPEAGQTTTLANAYRRGDWRGWRVHLNALDPVGADRPLDDDTRAALAEVAASGDDLAPCGCPRQIIADEGHEEGCEAA